LQTFIIEMDRKAFIILLVSLGFILGVWNPLSNKLFPPVDVPPEQNTNIVSQIETNALGEVVTNFVTNSTILLGTATNVAVTTPTEAAKNIPEPFASNSDKEEFVVLENDYALYTFTSKGGGIRKIELKNYPASITRKQKKDMGDQGLVVLNGDVPMPILSLLGSDTNLVNKSYSLRKVNDSTVEASLQLASGSVVTKRITLSTNYLIRADVTFTNPGSNLVQVPSFEMVAGSATPINGDDDGRLMNVDWYDGKRLESIGESWFANRTLGCSVSQRRTSYVGGDGMTNVAWAACDNRFFSIATVPVTGASKIVVHEAKLSDEWLQQVSKKGMKYAFQASFLYPETILQPNASISHSYDIYAGPKEYKTLAKLGIANNLDLIMGFSGFFGFFSKILLLGMNWVHSFFHVGYGVAIVIITLIIKAVFWPLTAASTRSMKRMSTLQPQMNVLRERYKDDPKKMNQKLMEFMKENKVNPMGGCLPILIQIPVFIGFYKMLMSAIELRGASFLWASDLSIPDTIFYIPGIDFPVNPLPLLMGATMLWQSSMTPASPGMDPVQQKMFRYMPLIFIFFCYSLPSGLSLYWAVQNLVSILQMKVTRATDKTRNNTTQNGIPVAPLNPAFKRVSQKKKK